MSRITLLELIEQASEHSKTASEALKAGQYEAAQAEMKVLSEKYQAFCSGTTDESPEQQKDDSKDHESPDEKSGVGDAPHIGHCVPS